jgi:hypothetical protein
MCYRRGQALFEAKNLKRSGHVNYANYRVARSR